MARPALFAVPLMRYICGVIDAVYLRCHCELLVAAKRSRDAFQVFGLGQITHAEFFCGCVHGKAALGGSCFDRGGAF